MYNVVLVSTMRYHLTLIRMAIIKKKSTNNSYLRGSSETET